MSGIVHYTSIFFEQISDNCQNCFILESEKFLNTFAKRYLIFLCLTGVSRIYRSRPELVYVYETDN